MHSKWFKLEVRIRFPFQNCQFAQEVFRMMQRSLYVGGIYKKQVFWTAHRRLEIIDCSPYFKLKSSPIFGMAVLYRKKRKQNIFFSCSFEETGSPCIPRSKNEFMLCAIHHEEKWLSDFSSTTLSLLITSRLRTLRNIVQKRCLEERRWLYYPFWWAP